MTTRAKRDGDRTGAAGAMPLPQRALLVAGGALAVLFLSIAFVRHDALPVTYFLEQDRFVLILALAVFAAAPLLARRPMACPDWLVGLALSTRRWAMLLLFMALLLWWGTHALMFDYPLTRDEHMVLFDMAVFRAGHLAQPLAAFWQPYAKALVPAFLLQPDQPVGLVSSYLPGNAALRLAFSAIADPAFMNPLLAAAGGLALLDIARREFPGDRQAVLLVMILYLSSAQMLVTAMTAYAMTAHLALNLIWLAAFLRGGRAGHGIALVVGAYACGLHQVIFHPLFAGPFLLWRLAGGHWRIVLLYGSVYAAACLGWALYPMLASLSASNPAIATANADFLHGRVLPLLLDRDPAATLLMIYNLLRFAAWQNLALLPLLVAAWGAVRRNEGLAVPLAAGMILSVAVIGVLLPYQGHGWGYRYLHGFIGSAALLGGHGWVALRRAAPERIGGMGAAIAGATLLTVGVSLPWLFYQAHRFTAPYAAMEKTVAAQTTPFAVIDTEDPVVMPDQVRNLPDLSNRPIRLSSRSLTPAMLAALCARGPVALITRADMHRAGLAPLAEERNAAFERLIREAGVGHPGCFRTAHHEGSGHAAGSE